MRRIYYTIRGRAPTMTMQEAYDKYNRLIWHFVNKKYKRYFRGSGVDPQDMAQEALVRMCKEISDGVEMTPEEISSIVDRVAIQFYRQLKRRMQVTLCDEKDLDWMADSRSDLGAYYDEMISDLSQMLGLDSGLIDRALKEDSMPISSDIDPNDLMAIKFAIRATARLYLKDRI